MPPRFDHEKLNCYQESIRFVAWAHDLLQGLPKKLAKRQMALETAAEGKMILVGIVSMLVGLIKSQSSVRVFEEPGSYRVGGEIKSKSRSKS